MKKWMILLMLPLAVAASSCGISGGDNGSGPSTKTDLEIRNVRVTPTDSSATVRWNTTQTTVGTVAYGRSQTGLSTSLSSSLAGEHMVELSSLDQDTEYWLQITASSPLGPRATIQPLSFRTLVSPDVNDSTAPVISDIQVVGITSNSATVTWKTDDRTHGAVFYGFDQTYGQTVSEPEPFAYVRSHSLGLSGLSEASVYHFRISAANRPGRGSYSPDQSFSTAEPVYLEITNLAGTSDTVRVNGDNKYTFSVRVRNASNIGGITFMLGYNSNMMGSVQVFAGSFHSDNGGVLFLKESEDPTLGRIEYGASWKITFLNGTPVGTLANGGGEIARITALATGRGTSSPLRLIDTDENGDGKAETRLFDYNRSPMTFRIRNGWVVNQVK